MSDHNPDPNFTTLSIDITEQILSLLPVPALVRASSVCKSWHSIISSPSFHSLIDSATNNQKHSRPWFFLFGLHNTSSRNNQSFAFDPACDSWFHIPLAQEPPARSCFIGSNGFFFTTTPRFSFSRILNTSWHLTSPLCFSRIDPLVGVFHDDDYDGSPSGFASHAPKFIVVGGVRFIGGLVDIEDRLAVEVYDPSSDSWELCPPLPADFRSGYSSQYLSSALFRGRFYVFGIYSFSVSSFHLKNHVWSEVQTLRPPGVIFSFLVACQNMLVLAGMCNAPPRGPSFNLWKIDEISMEFSEIAIMPHDFLYSLVDTEEDDKFASLKCVGLGNLIYVFHEEYHKKYPACVCEISSDSGNCSWRRVPQLPSLVNKFHKVISFCSMVSLHNVLHRG